METFLLRGGILATLEEFSGFLLLMDEDEKVWSERPSAGGFFSILDSRKDIPEPEVA